MACLHAGELADWGHVTAIAIPIDRRIIGAGRGRLLRQFLVESVVLSSIGGAIGIGLGISASWGLSAAINKLLPALNWPFTVSLPAAAVAASPA